MQRKSPQPQAGQHADETSPKRGETEGQKAQPGQESSYWSPADEPHHESENKFRNLSEDSLVGIYIIQDARFRYINPKMVEIFGYDAEEFYGGAAGRGADVMREIESQACSMPAEKFILHLHPWR